jgi:hypothetical protein
MPRRELTIYLAMLTCELGHLIKDGDDWGELAIMLRTEITNIRARLRQ